MEEKQKLIEDRKRKLERAKVITEALEVRAASRAETKILFGEQWLVACRRYRAVGSGAQTLVSGRGAWHAGCGGEGAGGLVA